MQIFSSFVMRSRMKFYYFFAFFFISCTTGRKIVDPFKDLENLADKVVQGADTLGQNVLETLSPVGKVVDKVDNVLTGGVNGTLNKDVFNVVKNVAEGLSEVVGIPVTLKDVHFLLATSQNPKNPIEINYENPAEVARTTGNIFFIIHGWTGSGNDSWVVDLAEVILRRYPAAHVLQVDWSKPAGDDYPFAAFHTERVGEIVANLTANLVQNYRVPVEKIVLIGHSLGGQSSGWAGKKFKKYTGLTLPLIVGLDPAGPLFCLRPESKRLNRNDAKRVMVIHSDGGELGMLEPCGTVDFFPNGGSVQPGCAKVNVIDLGTLLNPLSCNHVRSHDYFVEAINSSKAFLSRKCSSYTDFTLDLNCEDIEAHMGDLEENAEGLFYLETASKKPFSIPLKPFKGTKTTSSTTKRSTRITLQKNDRVYQVGNDIVIEIPDSNDTRSRVQAAPGDTIIYFDKGTTIRTVIPKN